MLFSRFCWFGLTAGLAFGCSAPAALTGPYLQNPVISDAQGHPRDSTTFYFPAADSVHPRYIPSQKRQRRDYRIDEQVMTCAYDLEDASYCLTYFQAPVLSNYYLGADTYRFLWLRSFHRPVLLTLQKTATGALLRTQLLDKPPGFSTLTVLHPDSLPPTASASRRIRAKEFYEETMADPEFQREVAEGKRRAQLVAAAETNQPVTGQQLRHFQDLLRAVNFPQLPACQPVSMFDGADWLLETHEAAGYHLVLRHSPKEPDGFRKACEYLIELSSVRNEERY